MFKKYQNKKTGEIINAVHFTANSIDETVKAIADQVCAITIVYENGEYAVATTLPFGDNKIFIAHEGDYIIENDEIPDTIPQLHNFKSMKSYEFERKFIPLAVIP